MPFFERVLYLVACHPVSWYRYSLHIIVEVYRLARFYLQLGISKQILGGVDLNVLGNATLADANIHWRQCMHCLKDSTLVVPFMNPARDFSA